MSNRLGCLVTSHAFGLGAAVGVPLMFYIATASMNGYWLDGGEFVAAAVELGISHPPGHPLYSLTCKLVTWLPLGPIEFRVALMSAFCAALACGFLFLALRLMVDRFAAWSARSSTWLALGSTYWLASGVGVWFQAIRPEVYALQAVLTAAVIYKTLQFEMARPLVEARLLYAMGLVLGLALANHHFLAFLILPALAPSLARLMQTCGVRSLFVWGAAVGLGLVTYVFLPLRAGAQGIQLTLGEPNSVGRFFWVVSAQAFQKNTGAQIPQPFDERGLDVVVQLVEHMGFVGIALAVLGLYLLMRVPHLRPLGFFWALLFLVCATARSWLGFVRSNPDAWGYLFAAYVALGALALCAVLLLGALVSNSRVQEGVIAIVSVFFLAWNGWRFTQNRTQASLEHFAATETFDEYRRRALPAQAVFFSFAPQTIFRHWGAEATEHLRPDITLVPVPFLTYPKLPEKLAQETPVLHATLTSYATHQTLRTNVLQSLAIERPVWMEMDTRVSSELRRALVPSTLLYELMPDGALRGDERLAAVTQSNVVQALYSALGSDVNEPQTRAQLVWQHYMDALYYAEWGDIENALEASRHGLNIQPLSQELVALQRYLVNRPSGKPVDITPFLPFE